MAATAFDTALFQPLDCDIVSPAIPAFYIGRNLEGFWVAREARGTSGGLFLFEKSAVSFARKNSRPVGCATIYPSERFELDIRNRGNPLIARFGPLKRLAMRAGLIKRFCLSAVVGLAACGTLAAIIALKAALSVWVFHHY